MALLFASPAWSGNLVQVRVGNHPTFTRVVFEFDAPSGYRIERRAAGEAENTILVTLDAASRARNIVSKSQAVESIEVDAGRDRAVAHITTRHAGLPIREMILTDPPRVVLDLMIPGAETVAQSRAAKAEPRAAKAEPRAAKAEPRTVEPEAPPEPAVAPPEAVVAEPEPQPAPPEPEIASEPLIEVPDMAVPDDAATDEAAAADVEDVDAEAEVVADAAVEPGAEAVENPAAELAAELAAERTDEVADAATEADAPLAVIDMADLTGDADATPTGDADETPTDAQPATPESPTSPSALESARAASRVQRTETAAEEAAPFDWKWAGAIGGGLLALLVLVALVIRSRGSKTDAMDVTTLADDADGDAASDLASHEGRIPEGGFAMDADLHQGATPDEDFEFGAAETHDDENKPIESAGVAIAAKPGLFDQPHQEEDAMSMDNQDLPTTHTDSEAPTQLGIGAAAVGADMDSSVARLVQEFERRLAHMEARLDESNEARERLERQVEAQAEELRVQRAAIARTQRAVRSLNRPDEDQATEPALRDPSTPTS